MSSVVAGLCWGIGAGGGEGDHKAYGLPYPSTRERVAMVGEAVQVIRLLWSGERVSFEGEYYRLANALCDPAPVAAAGAADTHWRAGPGERHLLRVAAAHADITNMSADMGIAEHEAKRAGAGRSLRRGGARAVRGGAEPQRACVHRQGRGGG